MSSSTRQFEFVVSEPSAVADLISRARIGDERAFTSLVAALQPRVYRWALTYARDSDEADEIAQETFVILSAVSTAGYDEMQPGTDIGIHCSTCADCSRVVTAVRERDSVLATTLAELRMTATPLTVAAEAIAARRKLTTRTWRGVLFGALMATLSIEVVNQVIPAYRRATSGISASQPVTEIIPLSCITSQQAIELATPFLRSGSPAGYSVRDIPAVTVRGVRPELDRAKAAIREFDIKCQLPPTTGAPNSGARPHPEAAPHPNGAFREKR